MSELLQALTDRLDHIQRTRATLWDEELKLQALITLYEVGAATKPSGKKKPAARRKIEDGEKRASESQRAITICLELIKKSGAAVHTDEVVKALKAEGYTANIGNIYAALSYETKKTAGRRIKRVGPGIYDATLQGSKATTVDPPSMEEFNRKVAEAKQKEGVHAA